MADTLTILGGPGAYQVFQGNLDFNPPAIDGVVVDGTWSGTLLGSFEYKVTSGSSTIVPLGTACKFVRLPVGPCSRATLGSPISAPAPSLPWPVSRTATRVEVPSPLQMDWPVS